jgi:protoheme IX farnesyltransferase
VPSTTQTAPAPDPGTEIVRQHPAPRAADFWLLVKPGILYMCLFMALGGMGMARALPGAIDGPFPWPTALWGFLGIALSVAASNVLNQYIERDGDRHMTRTRSRPLPAGRMKPITALIYGIVLAIASLVVMWTRVNPVSTVLTAFAIGSYVLVYTPMKRISTQALVIGAFPGAVPPLLGWTVVTGSIGAPGVALFLILFVWQLPHFMAIAMFRAKDYAEAGIHVVPNVRGLESAKVQSLVYSLLLVATSLVLVPMRVAGFFYFVAVTILGAWFFVLSMRGFEPDADDRWAKRFFFASLVYLPVLTIALVLDLMLTNR